MVIVAYFMMYVTRHLFPEMSRCSPSRRLLWNRNMLMSSVFHSSQIFSRCEYEIHPHPSKKNWEGTWTTCFLHIYQSYPDTTSCKEQKRRVPSSSVFVGVYICLTLMIVSKNSCTVHLKDLFFSTQSICFI